MKKIDLINKNNITNKVNEFYNNGIITFNVVTWEDGDGFIDLTNEDGGISSSQKQHFKLKDKCFKMQNKQKLFKILAEYIEIKCFSSKNKLYKLGFDIIITFSKYLIVFCPEFNEGYIAKLNIIERNFFILSKTEPWNKKKFYYWEKQK